jgi:dTDP-4-amino-4,6-dideoxygalactose transaminase
VTVVDEDTAPMARNDIMEKLQEAGISTRPGTHAVTELGYYKDRLGLQTGQFAVASRLERQTLALPLHNRMTAEDYAYVSETLHGI